MPLDFWRHPRGPFTAGIIAAAARHAEEEAPRESCGFVVSGAYLPTQNVAADPEKRFKISAVDYACAASLGEIEGVIHSHPVGPARPSERDMRAQIATAVPWAIVSTTGLICSWGMANPALFDGAGRHQPRQFCHGVSDCYTVVRDWYAEARGVPLPEFPRAWQWWRDPEKHGSLYLDNLSAAGFRIISTDPTKFTRLARPGDVALRRVWSREPSHAGVVLEGGLFIDQRVGSLSQRQPAGRILPVSSHLLRHESEP